jgi:very-short-patch-repair endonuclease
VMIFSIGYGRDETGKFIMNFGPLNKEGGERRLNVAVTRARYRVVLVSSIQPEDLDLSRTASLGVKLLRSYMTLARDGILAIYADLKVNQDADFESPFEASVYEALASRGLSLKKQVGVSGYRIDLAIVDPDQPGRFLLGIECDGAMYHSAKTARDRDRLRQDVLEGLGWHIHRIWSRDWIEDPQREVDKVLKALEQARRNPKKREPSSSHPDPNKSVELKQRVSEVNIVKIEEPQMDRPAEAIPYRETAIPKQRGGSEGFYRTPPQKLVQWVDLIVKTEGPIEIGLIVTRIARAWDIGRIGPKIRSTVENAIGTGRRQNLFEVREGFAWPKGLKTAAVRVPSEGAANRDIDQIPTEEVAEAVCLCLKAAISLDREDMVRQTAWLFGLRVNDKTLLKVNEAIGLLVNDRRIEWRENKLRIPKE